MCEDISSQRPFHGAGHQKDKPTCINSKGWNKSVSTYPYIQWPTYRICTSYPCSSGFCQFRGPGSQRRPSSFQSMVNAQILWLPLPRKDAKTILILSRIIDLIIRKRQGRKEYMWHPGDSPGRLWVFFSPITKHIDECSNHSLKWWPRAQISQRGSETPQKISHLDQKRYKWRQGHI